MDASEREEREPGRPRVVDKRVSARADAPAQPRPTPEGQPPPTPPTPGAGGAPVGHGDPAQRSAPEAPPAGEPIWTPEQEEQARRLAQEIRDTPSRDWVLNAAVTLANVAATKLDAGLTADAQLAIDALAGIVDALGARLGEAEPALRQTVAQLQMAYTQAARPPPGR
jgi:hypothetical protein